MKLFAGIIFIFLIGCNSNSEQATGSEKSDSIISSHKDSVLSKEQDSHLIYKRYSCDSLPEPLASYMKSFRSLDVPSYDSWSPRFPDEETSQNFESLSSTQDSLLTLILNHPDFCKLKMERCFNFTYSADSLVRLYHAGAANIGGTGHYEKNFIQVINNGIPKAWRWDDYNYSQIDQLLTKDKTYYILSSDTHYMTWWMKYAVTAFVKSKDTLIQQPNFLFGENTALSIDHSDTEQWEDEDGKSTQNILQYDPINQTITLRHSEVRVYKNQYLSSFLINSELLGNGLSQVGRIDVKLKFNGKYFEVVQ